MSSLDRYPYVEISTDKKVFEFTSTGPNWNIKKIIEFQETTYENVFNLAFGNLNPDGSIDDLTISNNKDRDKIFATIVGAIIDFTQQYPKHYVFFKGSTKSRTRLYRMLMTANYPVLSEIFEIWGLDGDYTPETFQRNGNYDSFLIQRK